MKKKTLVTKGLAVSAFVVGTVLFGVNSVFAYHGDTSVQGPNYNVEREAEMDKAFETKNYDMWRNLMNDVNGNGQKRVVEIVNQDNFAKFAEAHELSEQGKTSEAAVIRSELGLGNGNKGESERGQGKGGHILDTNNDGICDNLQ